VARLATLPAPQRRAALQALGADAP
jgi:hypothetical protein